MNSPASCASVLQSTQGDRGKGGKIMLLHDDLGRNKADFVNELLPFSLLKNGFKDLLQQQGKNMTETVWAFEAGNKTKLHAIQSNALLLTVMIVMNIAIYHCSA
jgi:hypothetical protein